MNQLTRTNNYPVILDNYKRIISSLIKDELVRKRQKFVFEQTLFGCDSPDTIKYLEIAHKIRQDQMKEGQIAQIILGNAPEWEDLGIGHHSGLDCRKKDNSCIIEVKNKWNTCNSKSEKTMLDGLVKYKIDNPDTRCIWGIINPKQTCRKLSTIITHKGVEIEKIQGNDLFKLVFTIDGVNYSDEVISFVKKVMYN